MALRRRRSRAATPSSSSVTGCRTRPTPTSLSLAAARAARDVLGPLPPWDRHRREPPGAAAKAFAASAARANEAVDRDHRRRADQPGVLHVRRRGPSRATVGVAYVGDTRAYWLPDAGPLQLTVDDSAAAEQIAAGRPAAEAETAPQAHAITRWLGLDAPTSRRARSARAHEPGWVLVCSDGLWNYCSEPDALAGAGPRRGTTGAARRSPWRAGRLGQRPGRARQHHCGARPDRPARQNATTATGSTGARHQGRHMAEFSAEVYQNEFLPDGGTDVHAIVTVTCAGAGDAGQTGAGAAGEIVIVDTSGSMGADTIGGRQARGRRRRSTRSSTAPGSPSSPAADRAHAAFPPVTRGPGWCGWTPETRARRQARDRRLRADGGTAMGTWLDLAGAVFASVPEVAQRHAILLTDGENQHEPGASCRGDQRRDRLLPVRLPRRRRRLAGRGDPPDRPGPAGHRRPDPGAGPDAATSERSCGVDGARGRRGAAARVGAAGRPGAVRAAGLPDGRGPHRRRTRSTR